MILNIGSSENLSLEVLGANYCEAELGLVLPSGYP